MTASPEMYGGLPTDVLEKVLMYLSINLTKRESCLRVGISYDYLQHLCTNNIENINDKVENAQLGSKIHHLKKIHKAGRGWQASAWFLERADRKNYGRELQLTDDQGEDKQKIKIGGRTIEF